MVTGISAPMLIRSIQDFPLYLLLQTPGNFLLMKLVLSMRVSLALEIDIEGGQSIPRLPTPPLLVWRRRLLFPQFINAIYDKN
jgi:hypothetical protein